MSDCINGRSGCIAATQIHYHTPGYVHLEDEITAAFAALRAQLAEVTRERDEHRRALGLIQMPVYPPAASLTDEEREPPYRAKEKT